MIARLIKRGRDGLVHWRHERIDIQHFANEGRTPFFQEALKWLPDGKVTAVDFGGGLGAFADLALARNPSASVWVLDGNEDTIKTLQGRGLAAVLHVAPDPLPFADGAVDLIHCSHVIEHLSASDLYSLLGEFKRILTTNGVLIISAPLLWERFYDDLSHVRPYPPAVLEKYLAGDDQLSLSRRRIGGFRAEGLKFRYMKVRPSLNGRIRSELAIADLIFGALYKLFDLLGFFYLEKTGFTATFRKIVQ